MSFPSPKDFYEKYREDSDGAQKTAHQIGIKLGSSYIQRLGLKEKNLESVAAVLNEFQREVQGDPNAKVIGDAVTMQCTGFCPIMRAALTLNISWEWLDKFSPSHDPRNSRNSYAWNSIETYISEEQRRLSLRIPF